MPRNEATGGGPGRALPTTVKEAMAATSDSGSFFMKFRQRREEKRRIESLRDKAEGLRASGPAPVAERVIADLSSRALKIEDIERQELKVFVQSLKDGKEELLRAEQDLEELDFRRHIGEVDDVEVQIRKESLGLRIRELKRVLERNLEEYRNLRAFLDAADGGGGVPATAPAPMEVPASRSGGQEAVAVPSKNPSEPTVLFDSFRMVRPPSLAGAPLPPLPAFEAETASHAAPREDRPAPEPAPPAVPSPPVEAKAAFPPLVISDPGLESLIVNHDFVPQMKKALAGDAASDALDDLSQLDALSKSLDRIAVGPTAGGDLAPVAVPAAPDGRASAASSSRLLDADEGGEDSTMVRRPATDSQTMMVAQPMLLLKGQDGAERGTFVLRPGVSTVGRGLDNEVVLDDRAVSRKHATIAFEMDGAFRLTDLGSENGTYVNGTRVSSQVLKDGDEIHMGKSTLIFSHGR